MLEAISDFAQSDCNLYQEILIMDQACEVDLLSLLKSSAIDYIYMNYFHNLQVLSAIENVNCVVRMCVVDSNFG